MLFFCQAAQAIAGVFILALGLVFPESFTLLYTLPSVLVNTIAKLQLFPIHYYVYLTTLDELENANKNVSFAIYSIVQRGQYITADVLVLPFAFDHILTSPLNNNIYIK